MNKLFIVARWEYLEKIKSKTFLISLFVTPIIMVTMGILPSIFATQEDDETKTIGVIDVSGELAGPLTKHLEKEYKLPDGQPNYIVETIPVGKDRNIDRAIEEADAKVLNDKIEGYCIINFNPPEDTVIEYRSKKVGDFRITYRIQESLQRILSEKKLVSMGLDPSVLRDLRTPINVQSVRLSTSGEKEDAGFIRVFFSAYIFLMMLFFLIVTSGQLLVRSVIEEKSNRIVEVLVSSCSPTELMAGKVFGLSGLGFTQLGLWTLVGLVISFGFGIDLVSFGHALLLIIYFVLGYLFYAAIFIGFGSPVTTEQEAQQITTYLVLILILPLMLVLPALQNPGAGWIKVLTYIPLLTPTMMALRIPIQTPSAWEIIATILLMLISIYFAMVAAGRIFRIAILATGKRPSLGEIIAWVRTG